MDALTLFLFVVGLVLLVLGAKFLVSGASALAGAVGISPLVIGLTVVSLGTSAPELAVTVQASRAGEADVGVGNVVGSSVFNVLFILGLSTLIAPLVVSTQLLKRDGPVMVAAAVLLFVLALDHQLSQLDGLVLVLILIGYTVYLIQRGRNEESPGDIEEAAPGPWPMQLGRVVLGLVLLVLGSRWLVNGAVELAEAVGLSPVVVGLTVVAVGTSLPEVAASLQATLHGERDIAIGNVVGSNIFNVLLVLGLAALVSPVGIPVPRSASAFDIPVVIAVTFAGLLSFATGYEVSRWEGMLFLGSYVAYTLYLILEATEHAAFGPFQVATLVFAVAVLSLLLVRAVRARRGGMPAQ